MAGKKAKKKKNWEKDLRESTHKVWLAGLGALATVEDQGGRLFDQLVKKGEKMETRGGQKLGTARDKVEASVKETSDQVESTWQETREKVEAGLKDAGQKVGSRLRVAKDRVEGKLDGGWKAIEDQLGDALHRFGVPTRDEIQTLTRRVEELNSKVDQLKGKAPVAPTRKGSAGSSGAAKARTIEVRSAKEGWTVETKGAKGAKAFDTKREAVAAAKKLGASKAPSQVVVFKQDGGVQSRRDY